MPTVIRTVFILLLFAVTAQAQTVTQQDYITARQRLRVGLDTSRYFTSIALSITGSSTHRQAPTAKAVWDLVNSQTFTLVTGPTLSGAGTAGSPLNIAQQGATNGQPLEWNSSLGRWAPGTDDGTTYTGGTGISVAGTVINNTAPDQTVSITGASGTYPNFTLPDPSSTNEVQSLSLTGQALGISLGGTGVTLPIVGVAPGTGIGVGIVNGVATVTNTGDTNAGDDVTSTTGGTVGYNAVFTAARNITSGNIFDNGFIGIGTNNPTRTLHLANYTNNYLRVEGFNNVGIELINNNTNPNATWSTYASTGTPSTPTALSDTKRIGAFIYYGHDGTAYRNAGGMDFVVDGAVTSNNVPSRWDLSTKNASWGVPLIRLTVRSDGKIGMNEVNPTSTLHVKGYGNTSSTRSFLAENSAGTDALWALDNGTVGIAGTGGTATSITGRDASNIITNVVVGSGLSFASGTLSNTAADQVVALTAGPGIGVSGTYPNFTVTNTGDTNAADDITTSTNAGGELTGPFGNLSIIPNAITNTKMADNSVGAAELINTAVTPGTYTIPQITVDGDGRITAASNGTSQNIYNTNGTLTAARTITMGTNALTFDASGSTFSEAYAIEIKGKADGTNYTRAINLTDASGNTKAVLSFTNTLVTLSANAGGTMVLGAGSSSWRYHELGWVTPNSNSVDPSVTSGNGGALWYNSSAARHKYNVSTAGLSARTFANLEDDFTGSGNTFTTGFTITGSQYFPVANANGGNISVTADVNMREGFTYILRALNNGTNSVTVNAGAGYSLLIDGSVPGSPANYVLTSHEVIRLTRSGTTIIIDK